MIQSMLRRFFLPVGLLMLQGLLCSPGGAAPPAPLVIAADGASDYVIVWAGEADEQKITEAAELLRALLARSTGVDLPVYPESAAPEDRPALYLGRTNAARRAGLPVDDIEGWSYLIRAVGRDVFLVGEDTTGRPEIPRFTGYAGTYKAVTSFLERYADIRFVLPGPQGIHVPRRERIEVETDTDIRWSPLFRYVIGRSVRVRPPRTERDAGYDAERVYDPYTIANNFFGRGNKDTDYVYSYGGHSYPDTVPREKYFETHPEYFALFRGERTPTSRNHLCISHPDVHTLLIEEMQRRLDQGYQMVELSESDGYRECQCEECQAIHPNRGEKLWIVHRALADEMNRRRPGKKVMLLAYVWTVRPPTTFDRFPENVVIQTNRYTPEFFRIWAPFQVPYSIYLANWYGTERRVPPRYAVDQVRLFLENGVLGIYLLGGLDCGQGSGWGLNGPSYYAFGKAMEDPTRDADDLEREFVEAAYGKAAGPMHTFFTTMHRRWEVRALWDRLEVGMPDRRYRGYPFATKSGDTLTHFFAPAVLATMEQALERALALAEDENVKARLKLVELEFRYQQALATVYHMFRAYRLSPGPEALHLVESSVRRFEETLAWMQPDGRPRRPGGLRSPYGNRILQAPDRAPFNWDFGRIRETGEYPDPEVEMRTRGGQGLPPYVFDAMPLAEPGEADDAPEDRFIDDTIRAPFDL